MLLPQILSSMPFSVEAAPLKLTLDLHTLSILPSVSLCLISLLLLFSVLKSWDFFFYTKATIPNYLQTSHLPTVHPVVRKKKKKERTNLQHPGSYCCELAIMLNCYLQGKFPRSKLPTSSSSYQGNKPTQSFVSIIKQIFLDHLQPFRLCAKTVRRRVIKKALF